MRTRDTENKKEKIDTEKKRIRKVILILYVLSFLALIICRYLENYTVLDFSDDNNNRGYFLGYFPIMILSLVLAGMLRKRYEKRIHFRSLTILILILIMNVPYVQYARQTYLNKNIELYESAIKYTLNQDNDRYFQRIELPERYDKIAMGSHFSFGYIIKSEDATKIYFSKGGIFSSKGYLYVIPKEPEKKGRIRGKLLYNIPDEKRNGRILDMGFYRMG